MCRNGGRVLEILGKYGTVNMTKKKNITVKLMLLLASVLWGLSFVLLKDVLETVPMMFLLAFRFSLAAVILSVIFFKKFRLFNKKYLIHGLISAIVLFVAYMFQTPGLTMTTPGNNAFLTSVYCVVVPFFFWIVSKKRPDRFNLIAAIVCLAGIGFVSLTDGFNVNLGDMLTLVCGVLFAVHIVSIAVFGKDKDPILYIVIQFAIVSVLMWISSFIFESGQPKFSAMDLNAVLVMLYLAVACSCIGFTFQTIGQKYVEPSSASLILSLEAVFGVLFSIAMGYEELTLLKAIGFSLIFVAVVISETKLSFLKRKTLRGAEQPDE